ncbi:MAG: hypothetical protein IPK81_09735 [Rhodospirillales bacterium]|nr:MAG: hypothetical protein IPK81_09735 [Rhodospirillales bacterium]
MVAEILPRPHVTNGADLKAHISARSVSSLYRVGSCRMGRKADAEVDPQFRVLKIGRPRVADASMMLLIVALNTNAPATKIGENCADTVHAAIR